jgi:hypothetical protein
MLSFLKTLLIIILVYYAVKYLFRLLLPYFLRYVAKKATQKMEQSFYGSRPNYSEKPKEGKITIDHLPKNRNKTNKPVGEYVDYEEID